MKQIKQIKTVAFILLAIISFLMLGAEPPMTEDTVDTYDQTMNGLFRVWVIALSTGLVMIFTEWIVNKRLKQIK